MNAAADDRGRLEANLAGSLALGNSAEHKRWLTTYVRHLAGEGFFPDPSVEICFNALRLMMVSHAWGVLLHWCDFLLSANML